jgi:hypothetical protein
MAMARHARKGAGSALIRVKSAMPSTVFRRFCTKRWPSGQENAYLEASSLPTGQPTLSEMVKSEHRVTIKRYANQRFYDVSTASYVSAADIAAMADDEKNVVVCDAATGEDITDFILAKNRFH